jgi:hypothetical protein
VSADARTLPKYPVYVPTKGRAHQPLTLRFLLRDRVPFHAVVEADEYEVYAKLVGEERLLVLPESGQGLIYARNWIKAHSVEHGHARHWQLDDNIRGIRRWYKARRIPCASGPAFAAVEDFTDRYTNVAVSGMNYVMFAVGGQPPFVRNVHVYSCSLIDNARPFTWRCRYNDDTDLCLQALAAGLCTVLVNVFLAEKLPTMKVAGGNTDDLYQGDGRLVMARSLERLWPGVVRVDRRYGRPQHVVNWRRFDTPLQLRDDVDLAALAENPNNYGMRLDAVKPVKSARLQQLQSDYAS